MLFPQLSQLLVGIVKFPATECELDLPGQQQPGSRFEPASEALRSHDSPSHASLRPLEPHE